MDLPNWLNREAVQLAVIFIVTMCFHFYFISGRISSIMEAGDQSSAKNE